MHILSDFSVIVEIVGCYLKLNDNQLCGFYLL